MAYVTGRIELLDLEDAQAEPQIVFQVPNSDIPEDDPDAEFVRWKTGPYGEPEQQAA